MFACKNCGGNVIFDIASGQLACTYCHTLFDPYEYEEKTTDAEVEKDFEATIFTCPQCGGEILSTDDTAAGFCSFCGASTVLYSRIEREHRPAYIIPFTKTKEDCKQTYAKLMRKAIFAPKELKDPKYIDGFRGIYMPYWTYYVEQKTPISIDAEKSHRSGDYIITVHSKLNGNLDAYYKGLSYDASSSFEDNLSETLAPYDVKHMKRFTPAFLSGFYADTADLPASVYQDDAMQLAYENSISAISSVPEFAGYTPTGTESQSPASLGTTVKAADYSMFPVWFLSYRNKDRVAYATVSGQTGKVVADVPVSIGKFMLGSLLVAIPVYIILCMFTVLTPGWTLTLIGVLALIANFIYSGELAKVAVQEASEEDKGKIAKENPEALIAFNNKRSAHAAAKLAKKLNKETHAANAAGVVMLIFLLFYMMIEFLSIGLLTLSFTNVDGSRILWTVVTIASFVFSIKSFTRFDRLPGHKGLFGLIFNMVSLIFASIVVFVQPVSDWWYYGAAFAVVASVLVTLVDVILAYNVLSTRKLPQFATHTGGDDRA